MESHLYFRLHEHSLIKAIARGYTWSFAAIAACTAFNSLQANRTGFACVFALTSSFFASSIPMTFVGRLCERDADCTSAKRLGTADVLIDDLSQNNAALEQWQPITWKNHAANYQYAKRVTRLFFLMSTLLLKLGLAI
jgi:hypothetical protein